MLSSDSILDIYLQPEEFYWGDGETRIKTLLGSCIAICMWHPTLKIGGMSHSLLPSRGDKRPKEGFAEARYVDEAVELFVAEVRRSGTQPGQYRVKIFGGANVLPSIQAEHAIGPRNYEMSKKALLRHGFSVFSEHTGGSGARNIILDLWSGETWMRKLS
ncbi:MAG: chemotaxis protein CheD [Spirochaetes bacterium]|nr:chemotaxis protein CheD [Spirochaetota bacterium]